MAIFNSPYQTPYQNPYQPYTPTIQNYQNSQSDNGIIWVQGESGAKAYPIQNGKSVVLFDSESERFFIKSADISGMPQPLRVFNYSEASENDLKQPEIDTSMFITREEFEKAISDLKRPVQSSEYHRRGENRNGKPLIQSNSNKYNHESVQ